MLTLDVQFVFERAGGPRALLDLLRRVEPQADHLNYATVQMWSQRGVVSAPWVVPVLRAMFDQGCSLGELLVDPADPFGDVSRLESA